MNKTDVAKKMSKSDRKYDHKATRKVGKMFNGGMKPLSHSEIVSSMKSDTRAGKSQHEFNEHYNSRH